MYTCIPFLYWIQYYVPAELKKVAFLLHKQSFVAALSKMPHPAVAAVEPLSVNSIELPHPGRKIPLGGLNQKMVMVVHEAVDVHNPAVTLNYF